MGWETDSVVVVALMIAVLGFLWSLHCGVRNLSDTSPITNLYMRLFPVIPAKAGISIGVW